ncbi:MAG TPA: wax ester/triacylglycerol synthase domain-containing protein, partial [Polyangia bacterium]
MNERLSAVDAAWLRMDSPTNRMMITSVLTFDEPIDFGALARLLEERLLPHERFRQRVVDGARGPSWELDPEFDLRSHLHHVALPEPGDRATLAELVSDLMSSPLDRTRPLWQAHLVDGIEGGGAALVVRLSHCIGDGIALVRLLLSLTDDARGAAPQHVGRELPHVAGLLRRARLA